jgi:hypothetical protein
VVSPRRLRLSSRYRIFESRARDGCLAATWAARLDEQGIAHGGIVDAHYGSGVSFRDPDGIALDFFAAAA